MSSAFRLMLLAGIVVTGVGLGQVSPAFADGRAFGVGPRFSYVRGNASAEESIRYSGGLIRVRVSPRTSIELAVDYHSVINDDLTQRIREYPIQGSVLMYPVHSTLSPYILGGIGWYSERVDSLQGDKVTGSTAARRVGYHAGLGGEIRLSTRASLHLDYRYTFIHFGDHADVEATPGALPLPGSLALQEKLKLSHEGSMWTMGMTVYF